ncbi:lipid II:glycine glycyltransferase FemX [Patescibacteria group bacterium]
MLIIKRIKNKKIWEKFISSYTDANFLQSWNWGLFSQQIGSKIFRLGFYANSKLIGVCLLIKKEAKRGNYLECPGGPLLNLDKTVLFTSFLEEIRNIGFQEKCHFVRIRPQLENNFTNKLLFKNKGFVSAPMHLHAETTWQLNLLNTEETLLRKMRKTTRYLIKKAIKEGVKIIKSSNVADVDILYKLQLETVARQHFIPFSKDYFEQEFKAFNKDKQIKIFKAVYKGQVLAAAFIIFYNKEAIYHYSGSSSTYPKIPASYLLQWEAIKAAKGKKCKTYNFWGISPSDNPKHRFAGVTMFKKGFGGFKKEYLHAQDLPLNLLYWPILAFEFLRKTYRRL